jgi:hypothetical protein
MSPQHDHDDSNLQEDRGLLWILGVVIFVILLGILGLYTSGCQSVQSVDWTAAIQQLKFYYDQIPPEQLQQLKDVFEKIK